MATTPTTSCSSRCGCAGTPWPPHRSTRRPAWLYLGALALALMFVNQETSYLFLLIMGILYNVQPIRTKDRPYLDEVVAAAGDQT